MTGDRLRELARAAEANAEFYTPSGVLAQQELETLAPAMAVLLADAIDALEQTRDWVPRTQRENVLALLARFRALGDTA